MYLFRFHSLHRGDLVSIFDTAIGATIFGGLGANDFFLIQYGGHDFFLSSDRGVMIFS